MAGLKLGVAGLKLAVAGLEVANSGACYSPDLLVSSSHQISQGALDKLQVIHVCILSKDWPLTDQPPLTWLGLAIVIDYETNFLLAQCFFLSF